MKTLLKLEEVALLSLSLIVYDRLALGWGWFPLLLFLPDLSMVGYLGGAKLGAMVYNFWHHRAVAVTPLVLGYLSDSQILMVMGCILFAHIAMDRLLGYGLKYQTGFHDTHLGVIGKNAQKSE